MTVRKSTSEAIRDLQVHERARKIQRELGSDLYRVEDYHDIARRLIEQEEELGLPVNPYPLNEEATGKEGTAPRKKVGQKRH